MCASRGAAHATATCIRARVVELAAARGVLGERFGAVQVRHRARSETVVVDFYPCEVSVSELDPVRFRFIRAGHS